MSSSETKESNPWLSWIKYIVFTAVWITAILMSFVCNNGFDPIHFIVACCCPICYLPFGIFCIMKKRGTGLSF